MDFDELCNAREAAANAAFSGYEFGALTVVGSSTWEHEQTGGSVALNKVAFVRRPGQFVPDTMTFCIRFPTGSAVVESVTAHLGDVYEAPGPVARVTVDECSPVMLNADERSIVLESLNYFIEQQDHSSTAEHRDRARAVSQKLMAAQGASRHAAQKVHEQEGRSA